MNIVSKVLFCLCLAWSTFCLGQIDSLIDAGMYEKALEACNKQQKTESIQRKSIQCLLRLGKINEAQDVLNQWTTSTPTSVDAFRAKGIFSMYLGKSDEAILSLEKARKSNTSPLDDLDILNELALAYWTKGDVHTASEWGKYIVDQHQKMSNGTGSKLASAYVNLGLYTANQSPERALEYYDKAKNIYNAIGYTKHPVLASLLSNIAFVHQQQHRYPEAIDTYKQALDRWESIYGDMHPNSAFTHTRLASIYVETSEFNIAQRYLDQALSIYNALYKGNHPDIASAYNMYGTTYVRLGKYLKALEMFQKAFEANTPSYVSVDVFSSPSVTDYYKAPILLQTLQLKANALEEHFTHKSVNPAHLRAALNDYYKCDTLIDEMRKSALNEVDKLSLGTSAAEVFENAIALCLQLSEGSVRKKPYLYKAFYFAEKNRSAILLNAIGESEARKFAGLPDEVLLKEEVLAANLSAIAQQLALYANTDKESSYRAMHLKADEEYRSFVTTLEKTYPEYYNLKFNKKLISIPEIQSKLDKKQAIAYYYVHESKQRLYIFWITKNNYLVKDIALSSDFMDHITILRNDVRFHLMDLAIKEARLLYKVVSPNNLLKRAENLTIIPDSRLSILPFEMLVTSSKKTAYLIENTNISYHLSATLLFQPSSFTPTTDKPAALLFAPLEFPHEKALDPLPATKNEVNSIQTQFNNSSITYSDTLATETAFKNATLTNYAYIHLATHGMVDPENTELSRVYLRKNEIDDGILYAGEIYNLKLNARLVSLSACQTGLGKITRGEGVIGLSRAFIYAGSQNLLVSFWNVADESTSVLMQDFYTKLAGKSYREISTALREAKLQMIKNNTHSDPYFWAPFIIIGQGR